MRAPLAQVLPVVFLALALAPLLAACKGASGGGGPAPGERFQPAFHEALRGSAQVDAVTTFRLRIPLGRGGSRLRLVFRAGDGELRLGRVTAARVEAPELASGPQPVRFHGQPGSHLRAGGRAVSDPLPLAVRAGDALRVTFEAEGALAASTVNGLPGSTSRPGAHAAEPAAPGEGAWLRPIGLATVEVEGPPTRALVAIGDSITEAGNLQQAWPGLAQRLLGVPIVNAGVSGQGVRAALEHLDAEVLALGGITDCVVLLGTNDLAVRPDTQGLRAELAALFARLTPFCQVWAGTLPPKGVNPGRDLALTRTQRLEVNRWLREEAHVAGVIDFEAALRAPGDPHAFLPGLDTDGIHPSAAGQRVMAQAAARVLRGRFASAP